MKLKITEHKAVEKLKISLKEGIAAMKKHRKFIAVIKALFFFALAVTFCASLFLSADEGRLLNGDDKIQALEGITYKTEDGGGELVLPATLKNLPPRTPVTLYAKIPPGQSSLYIKSVFAETRLYLNDELAYEFGRPGSYPALMNDPPTGIAIVPLSNNTQGISLRLEYLSPSQRNELSIPEIYVGSEGALISMLLRDDGFSLIFSWILIFLGMAMVMISLVFVRKMEGGISFLWLGLFSLSAGIWILGECDLSIFLIPYPSLLYAMAYIGMFSLTIPFLRFGFVILKPKNKVPIFAMLYMHCIVLAVALLLQLIGAVDLMKTLYWFHLIAPLAFIVFAADLLWEYFRHKNKAAKRFAPAVILLAAAVVLELVNYWVELIGTLTVIFQLGTLCFIIAMGIESGRYMREAMKAAAERLRLQYEVNASKEREQNLASENAYLDRINRLKSELMETISHEARTPLAVLSSYAGLVSMELKRKGVSEHASVDLDKIVLEAKRASNLIESMKKLTLRGKERTERVSLDISDVAYQAGELYRHIFDRRGITLTLEKDENIAQVLANPEELTQVLFNLLQNAKNHTKQGSVTIVIKNIEGGVAVSVRDTGEGIPFELLSHVFERQSLEGESGIGLALCKEIIESHGGRIEIESEENKGTAVVFTLPEYKGSDKAKDKAEELRVL